MELHITGAWDAADASGIHNVFRYLFDVPILASDTLDGKGETCWGRETGDLRQETCGDIKTARH